MTLVRNGFILSVLVFASLSVQGGTFHGTWTGTVEVTCTPDSGGPTIVQTSVSTWSLIQIGSNLRGVVHLRDGPVGGDCATETLSLQISGSVSGNSFSGAITGPRGEQVPISGAVSGSTLSAEIMVDVRLKFTLTRSSSDPVPGLVGTWSGTYTEIKTNMCGSRTWSARMVVTFFQEGDVVFMTVTLFDTQSPCNNQLETHGESLFVRLSGNTFSSTWTEVDDQGGESRSTLTGTVSGSTITGTVVSAGPQDSDTTTFTLSNSSALPAIQSFTATPEVIRGGESVNLLWSTLSSSSVSIDNGVGSQPATGSIAVTPLATTTYKLSAVGPSGLTSTAQVTVTVKATAAIAVSVFPDGMLALAGASGATDRYVIVNNGGAATSITLSRNGEFFSQSPSEFTLAPGASQVVSITANAQAAGSYTGSSSPSGAGVPAGLAIPIKLLVDVVSAGTTNVASVANRIDTVGAPGTPATATASFTNTGTAPVKALVVSDQPWIVPQTTPVTIPPNGSADVSFTLDPARRPDAAEPTGSTFGNLTLRYLTGGGTGKISAQNGSGSSSKSVTVTHTVAPITSVNEPPPLAPGEVALFLAGMGHVRGSVGVFLSDLTLLNRTSTAAVTDLKLFFSPLNGAPSLSASINRLSGNEPVALADIVKTVFKFDAHNGSMQIRTKEIDKIAVAANVFNSSDPKGTYGTVIPVFRSDRAVAAGGSVYLTGLRADANSHTNLYIQETSGQPVTVRADFYNASGAAVGTPQTHTIGGFKLIQLGRVVPDGAVSSIVTSDLAASGRFLAYATPVDRASGDTWAVADWARLGGYSTSEPVVIPVAGAAPGANDTYFRTDLAIMNSGSTPANGTLTYYSRTGEKIDKPLTIAPGATSVMSDVVTTLFNVPAPTVGFILLTPSSGNFVLNSRTYTTVLGGAATFGTSIPAIPVSLSLRAGQLRQFAGLEDSAAVTIQQARPGTFRTNFGMLETSGEPVTVRVTVRYTYISAGSRVAARSAASSVYDLAPRQFLQLSRLTNTLIGPRRDVDFGDMRGLQADFEVISGTGSVLVFTSSVDNGTGDSTTRTE